MEEAVHTLVDKGVRPQHIRISEGTIEDADDRVRAATERGSALRNGLVMGAAAGAAAAFASILLPYFLHRLAVPLPLILLRAVGGAAIGALFGALLAAVYFGRRKIRPSSATTTGDFIVTVKLASEDERAAEDVRDVLALGGGRLVPSAP